MLSVPLSVLDLSPVRAGGTTSDAFTDTFALAGAADDLGLARYWVAEHHNMPAVAATTSVTVWSVIPSAILAGSREPSASRFQTIGHGSANPVADNTTEAGRQLNRRTDIKVVLATN